MKKKYIILSITGLIGLTVAYTAFGDNKINHSLILNQLIQHSIRNHPSIEAAKAALAQVEAERYQVEGYYDGAVDAGAGLSQGRSFFPGGIGFPVLPRTGMGGYAVMNQPLKVGLMVVVGVEQLWLDNQNDTPDSYYHTLGYAGLRLPLWRDRGFRSQYLSEQSADQRIAASKDALNEVRSSLSLAVILAYFDLLESTSILSVSKEAVERYKQVLVDMQSRIQIQSAPAFQEHSAMMEKELSIDAELSARRQLSIAKLNLQTLLGTEIEIPTAPRMALIAWADKLADKPIDRNFPVREHPQIKRLNMLLAASRTDLKNAENGLRSNIYLDAQLTLTGEDKERPFGSHSYNDDHNEGYAVMLTIKRPWSRTKERGAKYKAQSRCEELVAFRESALRELKRLRAISEEQINIARQQLVASESAVTAARAALSSESERMQLGEGHNRDMLDARKDLTTSEIRLIQAASSLLRGRAQWAYTADSQNIIFSVQ